MKHLKNLVLFCALTLSAAIGAAAPSGHGQGYRVYAAQGNLSPTLLADAGGSITVLSPKDGAVLDSGSGNKLKYDVHLSPDGNHIHVYIDDRSPIIDRNVSGCPCTLDLPDLSPGQHTIAMKEATAGHNLTGVQTTITVTVK